MTATGRPPGSRHPILISVTVTVCFVVALVLIVAIAASLPSVRLQEAVSAAGRVVLSALAIVLAARAGWLKSSGLDTMGSAKTWLMFLVPAVWIVAVYPPLFSAVFAMLVVICGSVWPAALVHGVANAIIHTNRIGVDLEMTVESAALLVAAPIPMLFYAIFLLRARGSHPQYSSCGDKLPR